ncbi:MAG: O-antigen ligase family protein [Thermodesulfobacteriota bacterium]
MTMLNRYIQVLLILLIVFTPLALGSVELWAFSLMELGILLIIVLWAIQKLITPNSCTERFKTVPYRTPNSKLPTILILIFLLLILFQMLPLPSGIVKILSPKTYELRQSLSFLDPKFFTHNSKFSISFVPFVTQIEFLKWLTLAAFFLFLLNGRLSNQSLLKLIPVIMVVGISESLYGMFEFFSGHRHILYLEASSLISSVTGTFINRNAFAGYLLMVIPLNLGYLFAREGHRIGRSMSWRHSLSSLDGKTLIIAFGIVLMILALLFSASRMGILSLLLSFTLISLLFISPQKGQRFSKTAVFIFALALLWAAWIGLDAVISRFFTSSEDFKGRWMMWMNTLQIIKDYPLFGSGLGTFTQVFPMVRSFHIRGLVTHAENDFLQLASEVGIVGMGLLLILFIFLFCKTISGIRSLSHWESQRYIGMGGMVGILALMFHSLVERNIQVPANAFLYTFMWAIVLRISRIKKGDL